MSSENKSADKLFKPDRRSKPRPDSPDRRTFLRPTSTLQWRGLVAAGVAILVIYFIVSLISQ